MNVNNMYFFLIVLQMFKTFILKMKIIIEMKQKENENRIFNYYLIFI